jgi:putative addiction module killer protein/probable addiction module antidote protein
MIEVRETEVYADWFRRLRDERARARINIRIRRLSLGNPGDVKPVDEGISELRVDCGPGYRIYYVQSGAACVLLLCGGDKGSQQDDILAAKPPRQGVEGVTSMALRTKTWDAAEYLDSEEAVVAYVEAALEDGDPAVVTAALGDIARARGMSQLARDTGLAREALYRSLSENGTPSLPPSCVS